MLLLLLSRFSRIRLCVTPQTAAHQALPSLGFSKQEHWSGLPFPSPTHESEIAQLCPTLCNPMEFSRPEYTGVREGNGTPLQYSCLENPREGRAWWAAIYGVARSWTRLSNFTFTFHFHALEKEMATPSSVLAWRIPGRAEPGGLPSMGSHRVGHD